MALSEVVRFNENLSLCSTGAVALVYFPAASPSVAEVDAMRAHLFALAARERSGIGLLLLLPKTAGPPEGDARQKALGMFRSLEGRLRVVGAVLEGSGFGAAAKRAVLTLLLSSSKSREVKVFNEAEAASDWLAERGTAAKLRFPDTFELQSAVDRIRRGV